MKFYPIPDPRSAAVTPQMLADLQQIGILPRSLGAFAGVDHWRAVSTLLPFADGDGAKYWRDNAVAWNQQASYDYLMLARNADGSYAHNSMVSEPNGNIYSLSTVNFYREYASHFPAIPSFVIKTLTRYDAERLNFGPGTPMDYPVGNFIDDDTTSTGRRPTFPSNMALRFNPQNGQVEAFYVADYVKEYPLDWTPRVPSINPIRRLSDGELVSSVSLVLESAMDVTRKASAIRQLAA